MAFIRWKHNGIGGRQAYLIHAYRGPDGKPRQKMLAYLGDQAQLTPEHLAALKERFADLKVNWDQIKPPPPRPKLNPTTLNDTDLLRKIRHIRHQLQLSQNYFVQELRSCGLRPCSGSAKKGSYPYYRHFGILEKALERGDDQEYYLNPEAEIAPALRRILRRA